MSTPNEMATIVVPVVMSAETAPPSRPRAAWSPRPGPSAPGTSSQNAGRKLTCVDGPGRPAGDVGADRGHGHRADERGQDRAEEQPADDLGAVGHVRARAGSTAACAGRAQRLTTTPTPKTATPIHGARSPSGWAAGRADRRRRHADELGAGGDAEGQQHELGRPPASRAAPAISWPVASSITEIVSRAPGRNVTSGAMSGGERADVQAGAASRKTATATTNARASAARAPSGRRSRAAASMDGSDEGTEHGRDEDVDHGAARMSARPALSSAYPSVRRRARTGGGWHGDLAEPGRGPDAGADCPRWRRRRRRDTASTWSRRSGVSPAVARGGLELDACPGSETSSAVGSAMISTVGVPLIAATRSSVSGTSTTGSLASIIASPSSTRSVVRPVVVGADAAAGADGRPRRPAARCTRTNQTRDEQSRDGKQAGRHRDAGPRDRGRCAGSVRRRAGGRRRGRGRDGGGGRRRGRLICRRLRGRGGRRGCCRRGRRAGRRRAGGLRGGLRRGGGRSENGASRSEAEQGQQDERGSDRDGCSAQPREPSGGRFFGHRSHAGSVCSSTFSHSSRPGRRSRSMRLRRSRSASDTVQAPSGSTTKSSST